MSSQLINYAKKKAPQYPALNQALPQMSSMDKKEILLNLVRFKIPKYLQQVLQVSPTVENAIYSLGDPQLNIMIDRLLDINIRVLQAQTIRIRDTAMQTLQNVGQVNDQGAFNEFFSRSPQILSRVGSLSNMNQWLYKQAEALELFYVIIRASEILNLEVTIYDDSQYFSSSGSGAKKLVPPVPSATGPTPPPVPSVAGPFPPPPPLPATKTPQEIELERLAREKTIRAERIRREEAEREARRRANQKPWEPVMERLQSNMNSPVVLTANEVSTLQLGLPLLMTLEYPEPTVLRDPKNRDILMLAQNAPIARYFPSPIVRSKLPELNRYVFRYQYRGLDQYEITLLGEDDNELKHYQELLDQIRFLVDNNNVEYVGRLKDLLKYAQNDPYSNRNQTKRYNELIRQADQELQRQQAPPPPPLPTQRQAPPASSGLQAELARHYRKPTVESPPQGEGEMYVAIGSFEQQ